MSRERFLRLVVAPTLLFLVFTGTALALALLHPAKPGTPKTSGNVELGDPYNGETIFSTTCAGCHGQGGKGGGIGPKLAGAAIPLAAAKAQIDNGGGCHARRPRQGKAGGRRARLPRGRSSRTRNGSLRRGTEEA